MNYISEYEQKALDFLKATNTKLTIKYVNTTFNPMWNDTAVRNCYKVVLKRNGVQMTYTFWDSIHNTRLDEEPSPYDVLACLQTYEPEDTFEAFCLEYGYDSDSIRALKIYKAVWREYAKLRKLFSVEELALLAEIC